MTIGSFLRTALHEVLWKFFFTDRHFITEQDSLGLRPVSHNQVNRFILETGALPRSLANPCGTSELRAGRSPGTLDSFEILEFVIRTFFRNIRTAGFSAVDPHKA